MRNNIKGPFLIRMIDRNGHWRTVMKCRSKSFADFKLNQYRIMYPKRIYVMELKLI